MSLSHGGTVMRFTVILLLNGMFVSLMKLLGSKFMLDYIRTYM